MFHHRMLTPNPISARSIVNNYCLEYYGTNAYVNIGQPTDLNFNPSSDTFTISTWFKPVAADFQRCILAKATMDGGQPGGVSVFLGIQTNNIYCLVGGGENTSGGDISDLQWHMITLTVKGR